MKKQLNGFQYLRNEDFYEIIRRRRLKLDEVGLAIYLRGKYCYKGINPFPLSNPYICNELGITKKVLTKLRRKLQLKGVIKFDSYEGRGHITLYTMLDTIMMPDRKDRKDRKDREDRKGSQIDPFLSGRKGSQMGTFMGNKRVPNGHFLYKEINNKDINKDFLPVNIEEMHKETRKFLLSLDTENTKI